MTTTLRRSTRHPKEISYIAITGDSSGEEYADADNTKVPRSSKDSRTIISSKRKRVAKSLPKSSKAKCSTTSLGNGPCELTHSIVRHNPSCLLPCLPALLEWFEEKRDARGMPWRKVHDPNLTKKQRGQRAYEVLVSEIMLQQTQVATVIPYYNRWLEKFPTLDILAEADLPEVHALWKGLGYYRRAGFLLAAAKKVKEEYGSHIPEDVKAMQKYVPGMGRYTAGAVASIAYGIKAPVLDGNVQRLLSRALAIYAHPKSKQTLDILWSAAAILVEATVPGEDSNFVNEGALPGNINQALIELGSTVCRPSTPLCSECPLRGVCGAYQLTQPAQPAIAGTLPSADIEELCNICEPLPVSTNLVTRFPMKADKKKARVETSVVCAIRWIDSQDEEWWIMTKRPATGLLAGLWEFPTLDLAANRNASETSGSETEVAPDPTFTSVPPKVLPKLLAPDSAEATLNQTKYVGNVVHVFSHIHKTYEIVCSVVEWHGDNPPQLAAMSPSSTTASNHKEKKNCGRQDEYTLPVQALWVRKDNVLDQNVGVGTQKVWKLVQGG